MEQPSAPNRFVRQFALTQGRARSRGVDLALDTLVKRTERGVRSARSLSGEQLSILELTERPIAIAEVSALLHLHLGIARVLVSDMADQGFVVVSESDHGQGPDIPTLERLLDDLQSL